MARLRFVGPEPHVVPLLNRTVEPDELIDVPDDVFKSREWPEALWSVQGRSTKDKE